METLTYIKNFFRDKNIGSITPTSMFGIKRLASHVDFQTARTIVEYGPATGVISKYFLKQMAPDTRFVAFETNKTFVDILQREIIDPRFCVYNETAENVCERLKDADIIVSGIPFSFFSLDLKRSIIENTYKALRPGGKFLVYQFFTTSKDPEKRLRRLLEERFKSVEPELELLNVPPLRIYIAVK